MVDGVFPQDGVGGWSLEDYEWDPETGLARLEYEHEESGKVIVAVRMQPSGPKHDGWPQYANLNT